MAAAAELAVCVCVDVPMFSTDLISSATSFSNICISQDDDSGGQCSLQSLIAIHLLA